MDTPESGNRIRKMVEGLIYTLMGKDMKEGGPKTKNKEKEFTDIEMETYTMGIGKMTGDKEKV